jgi:hypothetical protein
MPSVKVFGLRGKGRLWQQKPAETTGNTCNSKMDFIIDDSQGRVYGKSQMIEGKWKF